MKTVKYDLILKAIHEYVKTHVTIKSIKSQIKNTLNEICDNETEKEQLSNTIAYFFRDHWNKDIETLECLTYEGEIFTNQGTYAQVDTTEDMKRHNGEYVLTIHNHPDNCCFQSFNDISSQASDTKEKYGITISKEGIMITKNTDFQKSNQWAVMGIKYTYHMIEEKIVETKEYKKMHDDYLNNRSPFNHDDKNLNYKEYDDRYQEMIKEEMQKDFPSTVNYLNNQFKTLDEAGFPISFESTYIPIDRRRT